MPVRNDLLAVRQRLDELIRGLALVEQEIGQTLDMRRVRTDADHLRESLELLGAGIPVGPGPAREAPPRGVAQPPLILVPDVPYDPALWRGAEDEGLGNQGRTAP